MADILPSRPELPDSDEKEPRVVGLDSDDADELLGAITSDTARQVLGELHEEPGPPSDLADRVDTSIQNAQYHLDRLESAELIESAGTAYSEKGREMTVYAPSDRALVVVAGNESDTSGLQSVLTQLLGGLGVVALGSVVVDRLVRSGPGPSLSVRSEGARGSGEAGGGGEAGSAANRSGTSDPAVPDVGTATDAREATSPPSVTSTATPTEAPSGGGDGGGFGIQKVTETPAPTEAPTATPAATERPETAQGETVAEVTRTAADVTQTAAEVTQTAVETSAAAGGGRGPLDAVGSAVAGLPPGALFFLGGVVALSFVALVWWR
ncbi:MarR family transcriptional regulator [Halobellus sp. Atlit-31R]|nr:MarR family transcriptional regulator [Halobellus sp. Atlit-31R]